MGIPEVHGSFSAKCVESEEEFNALLPNLVKAMNSNRSEWGYYHTLQDFIEIMNGNRHMLFYVGDIEDPKVIVFFQVSTFSTLEIQVELIWSWAESTLHEDIIDWVATSVALANGAKRLRANSCRHLAKKLMQQGYKPRSIDMIKDL